LRFFVVRFFVVIFSTQVSTKCHFAWKSKITTKAQWDRKSMTQIHRLMHICTKLTKSPASFYFWNLSFCAAWLSTVHDWR